MAKPLLLRHKPDGSKAALRSMTIFHTVNTSFFFFFLEAGGGGQPLNPFDTSSAFRTYFCGRHQICITGRPGQSRAIQRVEVVDQICLVCFPERQSEWIVAQIACHASSRDAKLIPLI